MVMRFARHIPSDLARKPGGGHPDMLPEAFSDASGYFSDQIIQKLPASTFKLWRETALCWLEFNGFWWAST